MKPRLALALSALLLTAPALLLAACGGADKAAIATVGNYPPFDFINEQGELDGLERELGDELCERANLECEWVLNEWDTLIPNLIDEQFDVILAGMSITAEREQRIDFTDAYYLPTPSVYLAQAGAGDEAAQGEIGVMANTIYSDYFTEMGRPFVGFHDSVAAIEAVLDGTVDAVIADHGYAVKTLAEHEGKLAIVGPSLLIDRGFGMGVRKGSELKAKLDEALASMKSDGSLNALIRKWVGEDASTF